MSSSAARPCQAAPDDHNLEIDSLGPEVKREEEARGNGAPTAAQVHRLAARIGADRHDALAASHATQGGPADGCPVMQRGLPIVGRPASFAEMNHKQGALSGRFGTVPKDSYGGIGQTACCGITCEEGDGIGTPIRPADEDT